MLFKAQQLSLRQIIVSRLAALFWRQYHHAQCRSVASKAEMWSRDWWRCSQAGAIVLRLAALFFRQSCCAQGRFVVQMSGESFSSRHCVMYVPGRHGGAEQREQRGQREQREQRQTGVGFSLCAAPSCPCALYFRVRVKAERRLGRD
jgi:hypothetical protein